MPSISRPGELLHRYTATTELYTQIAKSNKLSQIAIFQLSNSCFGQLLLNIVLLLSAAKLIRVTILLLLCCSHSYVFAPLSATHK